MIISFYYTVLSFRCYTQLNLQVKDIIFFYRTAGVIMLKTYDLHNLLKSSIVTGSLCVTWLLPSRFTMTKIAANILLAALNTESLIISILLYSGEMLLQIITQSQHLILHIHQSFFRSHLGIKLRQKSIQFCY